jgi:hypothetical protein
VERSRDARKRGKQDDGPVGLRRRERARLAFAHRGKQAWRWIKPVRTIMIVRSPAADRSSFYPNVIGDFRSLITVEIAYSGAARTSQPCRITGGGDAWPVARQPLKHGDTNLQKLKKNASFQ